MARRDSVSASRRVSGKTRRAHLLIQLEPLAFLLRQLLVAAGEGELLASEALLFLGLLSCRRRWGGVGRGQWIARREKKVIFSVREATIGGTGGSGKRRVAHLGRLARRLLLLFLPLLGRQDLDLGRRPLLALLRLSPVEDTVAELDAVLRGKTGEKAEKGASDGDRKGISQASCDRRAGASGTETGGNGMKLNGSAHLVGHLRLVGVEELAAAEELVDHHVLLGVLDARVEVEGGVLGEGLVGDDVDGTHLACSSCWGL